MRAMFYADGDGIGLEEVRPPLLSHACPPMRCSHCTHSAAVRLPSTCAPCRVGLHLCCLCCAGPQVDALCRPLSDVVDAMQLDTGLVIQNLKQVWVYGLFCVVCEVLQQCAWTRGW